MTIDSLPATYRMSRKCEQGAESSSTPISSFPLLGAIPQEDHAARKAAGLQELKFEGKAVW